MAKVTINARGCSVEIESEKADAVGLAQVTYDTWEKAREPGWNPAHSSLGFHVERSDKPPRWDTGLEGDSRYV